MIMSPFLCLTGYSILAPMSSKKESTFSKKSIACTASSSSISHSMIKKF